MTPPADVATLERVRSLQERVRQVQGTRPASTPVDTLPALSGLLPGGTLHAGGTYTVSGSSTLAAALAAGASQAGAWCAVVGVPTFGAEAAAALGVDLARTVVLPDPGDSWLPATQALVDVLGVVVLRPPSRVREGEAARLAARLRQRGAALVVLGDWPRPDVRLEVVGGAWVGLGVGHGRLAARRATVRATPRSGRPRQLDLWLPGPDQQVSLVSPHAARADGPGESASPLSPVREMAS
ncbi:hypothetical protein [Solicola sp. PLA-1-18]|uniref:hypothetical protein n=1 Tax=Solicola sp. PLA-1-18 TaxID=3380532 RepID=UPI003B800014